jgi:SWI/SNF-related matrix-associated actin-dependent regulator 1 of chromatin subfamily A
MSFLSSDDGDGSDSLLSQIEPLHLTPIPRMRPSGRIDVVIPARIPAQMRPHLIVRADLVDESTVRFSPFREAEPIFRRHGGREVFIDSALFWDIPIAQYRAVKAALECPANNFIPKLDTVPELIFKAVIGLRPRPSSPSDLDPLPKRLLSALFPHQRESVLFAVSRGFRVFVADDMGLGKTIEAIAIACVAGFPKRLKALVVSPNNLTMPWVDSFLQWTDICRSQVNVVLRAESLADTPLTVVSYTTVARVIDVLSQATFDLTIVDESHELKNAKTQTYKALLPIIMKSKYLLLLSGTPTLNRPAELFPQLKLLLPDVFWSFKDFALRYCRGVVDQFGHLQSGGCSHSDELKAVLEYLVMIRRQKTDVLTELPLKKRFHVKLDFVPSQELAEMMHVIRVQRVSISVGMDSMKCDQQVVVTKALSLTAKEKLGPVRSWFCSSEFRRAFFLENRKCLIFGHHIVMLHGIRDWMAEQGVEGICITGSTTRHEREDLFMRFRNDPNCRVAVLSIEIAATGLTLVQASLVVFVELKWTPADHQQAEDRVHRIGQTRDVEIFYLHAEGSIDDRIWEILEKKLVMISNLISSKTVTFETDHNAQ